MKRLRTPLTIFIALTLLTSTAFAQGSVKRGERNKTINIRYGKVIDYEIVKVKSKASQGAAWGGAAGLAVGYSGDTQDALVGAAAGAALGALVGQLAGGKHQAQAYVIRLADGSDIKVITNKSDAQEGDCVSVEEGKYTNLRPVSDVMCTEGIHHDDEDIWESHVEDAQECDIAKQQLLRAETDEDLERAKSKVQVLCH